MLTETGDCTKHNDNRTLGKYPCECPVWHIRLQINQFILSDECKSSAFPLTPGAPKGTVLEPILFTLYKYSFGDILSVNWAIFDSKICYIRARLL